MLAAIAVAALTSIRPSAPGGSSPKPCLAFPAVVDATAQQLRASSCRLHRLFATGRLSPLAMLICCRCSSGPPAAREAGVSTQGSRYSVGGPAPQKRLRCRSAGERPAGRAGGEQRECGGAERTALRIPHWYPAERYLPAPGARAAAAGRGGLRDRSLFNERRRSGRLKRPKVLQAARFYTCSRCTRRMLRLDLALSNASHCSTLAMLLCLASPL